MFISEFIRRYNEFNKVIGVTSNLELEDMYEFKSKDDITWPRHLIDNSNPLGPRQNLLIAVRDTFPSTVIFNGSFSVGQGYHYHPLEPDIMYRLLISTPKIPEFVFGNPNVQIMREDKTSCLLQKCVQEHV